jgi:predicted nucleic acid-binding Zn ribbon protein
MHSSPRQLGTVLQSALEHLGIGTTIKRHEVVDRWPEIVGEKIARATRVDHLEGDKLFVVVSTSVWRNELVFLKRDLIDRVNASLGEQVISDIIFR